MYNTFNMGIGMVVAVAAADVRTSDGSHEGSRRYHRTSSDPSRQEKRE